VKLASRISAPGDAKGTLFCFEAVEGLVDFFDVEYCMLGVCAVYCKSLLIKLPLLTLMFEGVPS
jgi:hypothetical protein